MSEEFVATLKQKLTSRKFWVGVAIVAVGIILCAAGFTTKGASLIVTGGITYIGAECIVDVVRAIYPNISTEKDETATAVESVVEAVTGIESPEPITEYTEETLTAMTNTQLKKLAEELGVSLSGMTKKAQYVAAILAAIAETENTEETEVETAESDGDTDSGETTVEIAEDESDDTGEG